MGALLHGYAPSAALLVAVSPVMPSRNSDLNDCDLTESDVGDLRECFEATGQLEKIKKMYGRTGSSARIITPRNVLRAIRPIQSLEAFYGRDTRYDT